MTSYSPTQGSAPTGRPQLRPRRQARTIVGLSLAGVAIASVLVFLVVGYAARHPDEVHLGSATFPVGKASRLAERIREQRTPLLFKDPLTSGVGRELYVQHLGDDATTGWLAFEAYAPGAPREVRCILKWSATRAEFRDPCGGATYPADGDGLVQYPTDVDGRGVVVVDLRPRSTSTTTTTPE